MSLGSGMDARPWRLVLPDGLKWFEVDWAIVVDLKRKLLREAGAAMDAKVRTTYSLLLLQSPSFFPFLGKWEHSSFTGRAQQCATIWVVHAPQSTPE